MNAFTRNSILAQRQASLQHDLASYNSDRLRPGLPSPDWRQALATDHEMRLVEGQWIETERASIADSIAMVPAEPDAFLTWFEDLKLNGPGQGDALFPWLAEHATGQQMRWFIAQEVSGEAGFDDLVAMTQVRLPTQSKLELARNYWDEMGRGNRKGMHGPMLAYLAAELALESEHEDIVPEALALGNMMVAFGANRRYAYQSVGALGVIEMTAPTRVGFVNAGLKRLGFPAKARHYFALHATLDVAHSEAWNREVLHSLVAADPTLARPLAEGALMRLTAGARCFARYRRELGLD